MDQTVTKSEKKWPSWWEIPVRDWVDDRRWMDGNRPVSGGKFGRVLYIQDRQRQKCYNAETTWAQSMVKKGKWSTLNPNFNNLTEIAEFILSIRKKAWYKRRFMRWGFNTTLPGLTMKGPSARGGAWATPQGNIAFGPGALNLRVVLHELAHVICGRHENAGLASHGRRWVRIYLELVLMVMGKEAHDELKAAFKAHGVKYLPLRKMTPEAREKASLRFTTWLEERKNQGQGLAASEGGGS